MKYCARCGSQLPDDSCFCQFCGVRLAAPAAAPSGTAEAETPEAPVTPAAAAGSETPAAPQPAHPAQPAAAAAQDAAPPAETKRLADAAPVPPAPPAPPGPSASPTGEPPERRVPNALRQRPEPAKPAGGSLPPGRMAVLVLSVLAVLLAGLSIWQGAAAHRLRQEAAVRSELLDTQKGEIAELERQRRALIEAINGSGTPGFGSMYFFASDGVITVDHTQLSTTFKLYTPQHPDNYRVYISTEGDSAEVALTESEWEVETLVCVTPKKPGMTIATFSNSAGTATFRVYIIVA